VVHFSPLYFEGGLPKRRKAFVLFGYEDHGLIFFGLLEEERVAVSGQMTRSGCCSATFKESLS
jgi:hypothetical protein